MAPAQAVILETDPVKARAAAREHLRTYVPRLPKYKNHPLELGYTESDFADGCNDRLVDDIVAWGDVDAIKARIQAHHNGESRSLCILPLATEGRLPNMATVEALAPGRETPRRFWGRVTASAKQIAAAVASILD